MKIYFFGTKTNKRGLNNNYDQIIRFLKNAKIDLFSNLKERSLPSDLIQLRESGGLIMGEMDALIIEGTESSQDIGYLLALAIAQRKPALYIYERGKGSQDILKYLTAKKLPKTLQARNYQKKTLEKTVLTFLKTLKGGEVKEIPKIKFTLRITPSIEKYLHYKTHNTQKSKADFLREYVEKMMKLDNDYQNFLKKGD